VIAVRWGYEVFAERTEYHASSTASGTVQSGRPRLSTVSHTLAGYILEDVAGAGPPRAQYVRFNDGAAMVLNTSSFVNACTDLHTSITGGTGALQLTGHTS
jgi:hypothetical protein